MKKKVYLNLIKHFEIYGGFKKSNDICKEFLKQYLQVFHKQLKGIQNEGCNMYKLVLHITFQIINAIMNQNCIENVLLKACELTDKELYTHFLKDIVNNYYDKCMIDKFDEQIDLSESFNKYLSNIEYKTFGDSNKNLENGLKEFLKRKKIYILRTGTVGGAGHYQLLYFKDNRWHNYSSPTNHCILMQNDELTEDGKKKLVVQNSPWGDKMGNYIFMFVDLTDILKELANFVIEERIKKVSDRIK